MNAILEIRDGKNRTGKEKNPMSKRFNYHFQPLFFKDPTEKIPADDATKIVVMRSGAGSFLYTVLAYYLKDSKTWYKRYGAVDVQINTDDIVAWADFNPEDLFIMERR